LSVKVLTAICVSVPDCHGNGSVARLCYGQSALEETSADIWLYSLSASELRPLVQSPLDQMYPVYSRDGRWIAYQSNESGRYEVYVQPASGSGGRWQVSRDGGLYPLWNRNGREMFYVAPPNRMMVVPVSPGKTFEVGVPRVFSRPTSGSAANALTTSPRTGSDSSWSCSRTWRHPSRWSRTGLSSSNLAERRARRFLCRRTPFAQLWFDTPP